MKKILENIELVLTGAGLLVIALVNILAHENSAGSSWRWSAGAAVVVGVLHGFIFWLIRRRQRSVRRAALAEARVMLRDVVNNQLCVIQFMADLSVKNDGPAANAHARITECIGQIDGVLDQISEESLARWKARYRYPKPSLASNATR